MQVFVGTMEQYNRFLKKKTQASTLANLPWLLVKIVAGGVILHRLALVVSGLIQVYNMANRSVSLSEINFAMMGYLLCIDLIFA